MMELRNKSKMKLLVILALGPKLPSGYIRGLIYREYFIKNGYNVKYVNYFSNNLIFRFSYLRNLHSFVKEMIICLMARNYDIIYMSKVQSARLLKWIKKTSRARIVFDFGDALWLPAHAIPEFNKVFDFVDAVTTDNEYTARRINKFNINCTVVPDCPQIELFDKMRASVSKSNDGSIVLGWVGSPTTAYNLFAIWEPLEKLFIKFPNLRLRLLGVGKVPFYQWLSGARGYRKGVLPLFEHVRFSVLPEYTQSEMIKEVLAMDIGLFPLQDVEISRSRGILKASVYMSGEAVAVCSPIGQCADFIRDGQNGMLVKTQSDWEQKIELLVKDRDLRQKIARNGLETVRSQLKVEDSFKILNSVLTNSKL